MLPSTKKALKEMAGAVGGFFALLGGLVVLMAIIYGIFALLNWLFGDWGVVAPLLLVGTFAVVLLGIDIVKGIRKAWRWNKIRYAYLDNDAKR